jgi:hypothetical protein
MIQIFADASNILKLRLCLSIMCNILVVAIFCHAGQMLIDVVASTTSIEMFPEQLQFCYFDEMFVVRLGQEKQDGFTYFHDEFLKTI